MEIQLNETKVREMAGRLRKAFGADKLGHSKALEAVAQTLGHPNWDTLSGMLKREEQARFRLERPVTLYVTAFSCDEFGESPSWAKVVVDQEFLDTLLDLRANCRKQGFQETAVSWPVALWENDETYLMRGDDLLVGKDSWWLRSHPKHCDYNCETRMIDVDCLLAALKRQPLDADANLAWCKDILVYERNGAFSGFVEELVEAGELGEDYMLSDATA